MKCATQGDAAGIVNPADGPDHQALKETVFRCSALDRSPAITGLGVEMLVCAGCICQGGHGRQDTLDAASATSLCWDDTTVWWSSERHKGHLGVDTALLLSGETVLRYREQPQS